MIAIIVIALITAFMLYWVIKCCLGRRFLKEIKQDSLIVFGKKGKGKTLLFSEMTRMDKKHGYLSNTDFKHKKQQIIKPAEISVKPNTWADILEGKIVKIDRKDFENKPVYLDDAGIYFPNFADSLLKRLYDCMPPAFAIWRHLYNAPIHINSQDVNRVWKLLKEQQNGAIQCRKTWRLGPFAIIHCTYYSNLESAAKELLPMKENIFNKYNKAELNLYNANNGMIKDFVIFAPTWRNKYDSRYFRTKFFKDDCKEDCKENCK